MRGLTQKEVEQKQKQSGYNELPDRDKKSFAVIIVELLKEPMIFLLVAIVVVYFLLGDKSEAFVLMVSVFVIMGIELYQETKTEKALEALRHLASPRCTVVRDGKRRIVAGRELVVGDIIVISEGERVPADALLLSAENLAVDESLLTGESVAVDKSDEKNADDAANHIYSSSMIVKGHGVAEVKAIGLDTEVGKIGRSLNDIVPEKTLLQQEISSIVKKLAIGAISVSVLLIVVFWMTRGDLLGGFLAGLTLSIAVLPEEFPVVLTVFMALGAWRLAKNNVLARKSQTVETLGSTTVLCTDKTGTLTQNKMTVARVIDRQGEDIESDDSEYRNIIRYGVLASQKNPFDPMEEAFIEAADNVKAIYGDNTILKEYPLEETSLSVVHVWADAKEKQKFVAMKGAPEAVFKLCRLSASEVRYLHGVVARCAKEGLRVLAVARGEIKKDVPDNRDGYRYELLGLVALADPIRKEARSAVKLCRSAGIRVIMITGDYPETARRIGSEVGIDSQQVITGETFSAMSKAEQVKAIAGTSIFSRVSPVHKLKIVNALKQRGEVVAMTGDGVNDAPALKAAHIGIAMGERGTDVAREASSIVLLDDNFASIVKGIRLGRRIFTNLQKAMAYILTVHIPIIVLSLLPVLFGWPIVLMPIHIVFLEFIIDPSCTLIFEGETEDADTMRRPPRALHSPIFSKEVFIQSLVEGVIMSAVVIAGHWWMLSEGWADDKARAISFLMVVLMNLFLIVAISGRRVMHEVLMEGKLTAMVAVGAVAGASLIVIYTVPMVRNLFKLAPIAPVEIVYVLIVAAATAALMVPLRMISKRVSVVSRKSV